MKTDLKTNNGHPINLSVDLPIVIGTWPRADIPIDEDYEDRFSNDLNTMMIDIEDSDTEDEKALKRRSDPSKFRMSGDFATKYMVNTSRQSLFVGKRSSFQMPGNMQNAVGDMVDRSDSNGSKSSGKSYGSVSSWHSRHSWGSPSLSRNTSLSTALNSNDSPQTLHRSSPLFETQTVTPAPTIPVQRGTQQRPEATRTSVDAITMRQSDSYPSLPVTLPFPRGSFVKSLTNDSAMNFNYGNNNVYPQSAAPASPSPHFVYPPPLPPITSDSVPTRILQPIHRTAPKPTISTSTPIFDNSSDDNSSDEDDLLHIVRKKKKQQASRVQKDQQQQLLQQRSRPVIET